MELKKFIEKAKEVKSEYASINKKQWGASEYTQGLVGDVGDLMKLMMAKNGLRKWEDIDDKIKGELCECLWSILIISDEIGIDLENEFSKRMDYLKERINQKGY